MQENARIRGLFTIVKFIDNPVPSSPNRLVTKTIGKYGFVSSDYEGPAPKHDEFWLVRIDREIKANSLQGCFVLTPVKPIDRQDISILVSGVGHYSEYEEEGIRYILPVDKDKYYVLPLEHRKNIKTVRSVIVVNFSLAKFVTGDRYFYYPTEDGYHEERESYTEPGRTSGGRGPAPAKTWANASQLTASKMQTPYDGNGE